MMSLRAEEARKTSFAHMHTYPCKSVRGRERDKRDEEGKVKKKKKKNVRQRGRRRNYI